MLIAGLGVWVAAIACLVWLSGGCAPTMGAAQLPPMPAIPNVGTNAPPVRSVTLAWDPSPDPTVAAYNIYQGVTDGAYTNEILLGLVTNVTISPLVPGATYWFAATAVSMAGIESDFSTSVSYSVPAAPVLYTNYLIGLTLLSSEDGTNWLQALIWNATVLTNPSGSQLFFKGLMSITPTNLPWGSIIPVAVPFRH